MQRNVQRLVQRADDREEAVLARWEEWGRQSRGIATVMANMLVEVDAGQWAAQSVVRRVLHRAGAAALPPSPASNGGAPRPRR